MNRFTGTVAALLWISPLHALAQQPSALTLNDAQQIALANRPLLRVEQLNVDVARQNTFQADAARYPQLSANVTAADAYQENTVVDGKPVTLDTRIAAGGLNNPTVLRRQSNGLFLSQLVTDFGRTANLVESAKLSELAQHHQVSATRAQILLEVGDAYFTALEGQAVLQVAAKTVDARRLLLDKIVALAKSKLKSELDVRFAQVRLDEGRLLMLKAENAVDAAFARLSTSMGYRESRRFTLVDVLGVPAPPPDIDSLMAQAMTSRPELARLRADREAAQKFAQAQKALRYPTINIYAGAGVTPWGDDRFPRNYGAIGINLNLPLLDGGKISALQDQAQFRTEAISESLAEAENNVVKSVRVAWLGAKAGYETIDITGHFRDTASQALNLAESRYNLGITSIIELNQAQLSAIDAEIAYGQAKYEYLKARAALEFQTGTLETEAPVR